VAQLAIAASAPFLSRIYDPDEIGGFAVFASVVAMIVVVASLRYEQAIPLPGEIGAGLGVLAISCLSVGVVTAVTAFGVVVWGPTLTDLADTPGLADAWRWLPVAVAMAGLFQALTYWVVRSGQFHHLAVARAVQGLTLVGIQIGAGFAGFGLGGLIGGFVASWTVGMVVMLHGLPSGIAEAGRLHWGELRSLAARYLRFPLLGAPAALCNRAALEIPAIALAAVFGPAESGYFLLAQRTVAAPVQLVGQAVGQVYMNQAAQLARDEPGQLAALYRRIWVRLLVIGLAPTAVLLLFGPALYALVFGEDWRPAGVFAQLLALSFLTQLAITPLTSTFAVIERQDLQLYRDSLRVAAVIGVFVLAGELSWSPNTTVAAYSAVMVVGYLTLLWLGRREVMRGSALAPASAVAADQPTDRGTP
jgi:O-antigen/teichoic acid export membrane protein